MNKEQKEKEQFMKTLENLTVEELKEKCWELRKHLKARYGGRTSSYSIEVENAVREDLAEGLLSYAKIATKNGTSISYVQRLKTKMNSEE